MSDQDTNQNQAGIETETLPDGIEDPEKTVGNPEVVAEAPKTPTPDSPAGSGEVLTPQKSRGIEAGELAYAMGGSLIALTKDSIVTHLRNHPECLDGLPKGANGEDDNIDARAEKMADEIIALENQLIARFITEINKSYPDADTEQKAKVAQAVNAVREGLYSVIINGALSGEKIYDLVADIRFQKTQGEEVAGSAVVEKDKIVAFIKEGDGGKLNIFLYDSFLETGGQAHVVRHELAHAINEASNMWPEETYGLFLECARNPSSPNRDRLPPALKAVIGLVETPKPHIGLWSGYISSILARLDSMEEGEEKTQFRALGAREIAADMTAFYLESDGKDETFLEARMQFSKDNIVSYLKSASNTDSGEALQEFCAERGANINIQNVNLAELYSQLAHIPEFQPLFGINRIYADEMRKTLGNRGAGIARRKLQPNLPQGDEYYLGGTADDEPYNDHSQRGAEAGEAPSDNEDAWSKIWGFLTGEKSGRKETS